jgi:hypothetical protein
MTFLAVLAAIALIVWLLARKKRQLWTTQDDILFQEEVERYRGGESGHSVR